MTQDSASSDPSVQPPALFRDDGTWWLPENPDERRGGRLDCLVAHGVRLYLQGSFDVNRSHRPWQPDIILGEVAGRQVTLYRCWRKDVLEQRPGNSVKADAEYAAEAAIVGVHITTPNDVSFCAMEVSYTGMPLWLGVTGISCRNRHFTDFSDIGPVSVCELEIRVVTDFGEGEDPQLLLSGEKLLYMRFERNDALPFYEWRAGPIRLFQDFLTFVMGTDAPPVRIRIHSEADRATATASGPLGDVDIYVWGMNQPGAKLDRPDFLLWASDMDGGAGDCLKRWFDKAHQLRPARELYCDVIRRGPSLSVGMQFFLLMLALEGYHRCSRSGKYLSDDEYKLINEQISKVVKCITTEGLRESLLSRLRYGNEFSLRRRLKKLVHDLGSVLGQLEPPVDDMVNARNDMAHPGPDLAASQRNKNDLELSLLADYAQALLDAGLLSEIGVPQRETSKLLRRQRTRELEEATENRREIEKR